MKSSKNIRLCYFERWASEGGSVIIERNIVELGPRSMVGKRNRAHGPARCYYAISSLGEDLHEKISGIIKARVFYIGNPNF